MIHPLILLGCLLLLTLILVLSLGLTLPGRQHVIVPWPVQLQINHDNQRQQQSPPFTYMEPVSPVVSSSSLNVGSILLGTRDGSTVLGVGQLAFDRENADNDALSIVEFNYRMQPIAFSGGTLSDPQRECLHSTLALNDRYAVIGSIVVHEPQQLVLHTWQRDTENGYLQGHHSMASVIGLPPHGILQTLALDQYRLDVAMAYVINVDVMPPQGTFLQLMYQRTQDGEGEGDWAWHVTRILTHDIDSFYAVDIIAPPGQGDVMVARIELISESTGLQHLLPLHRQPNGDWDYDFNHVSTPPSTVSPLLFGQTMGISHTGRWALRPVEQGNGTLIFVYELEPRGAYLLRYELYVPLYHATSFLYADDDSDRLVIGNQHEIHFPVASNPEENWQQPITPLTHVAHVQTGQREEKTAVAEFYLSLKGTAPRTWNDQGTEAYVAFGYIGLPFTDTYVKGQLEVMKITGRRM